MMHASKRSYFLYGPALLVFFAVMILDRFTKIWACEHCILSKKITSWLSCYVTFNRGISWGIAHEWSGYAFYAVIAAIALALVFFLMYIVTRVRSGLSIFWESVVFAGALSNFFDRILFSGHVIDFIHVHYTSCQYGTYSFPIFNCADCAIFIGICALLIKMFGEP